MPAQDSYLESSEGDKTQPAFEELVSLYYAPLYRFAMSLTRAENDACDLVQETFLTWAEKGRQLQDPKKVRSWLFTTLHRAFLQSQRRATRFPHLEIGQVETEIPPVESDAMHRLGAQEVLALLARVDPQFQAAVALFYLEESSYQEIADILEVPLGTVKSRIARGLQQLKQMAKEQAAIHTKGEPA